LASATATTQTCSSCSVLACSGGVPVGSPCFPSPGKAGYCVVSGTCTNGQPACICDWWHSQ